MRCQHCCGKQHPYRAVPTALHRTGTMTDNQQQRENKGREVIKLGAQARIRASDGYLSAFSPSFCIGLWQPFGNQDGVLGGRWWSTSL